MLRTLLILLIIFVGFYLGKSLIKRYLNKKITNIFNAGFQNTNANKKKEVLYRDDDVVVLKGEAKDKNSERQTR